MKVRRLPGEQNERLMLEKDVIKQELASHRGISLISAMVGVSRIENEFWLEGPTGKRHYFHDNYSQIEDLMSFQNQVRALCFAAAGL